MMRTEPAQLQPHPETSRLQARPAASAEWSLDRVLDALLSTGSPVLPVVDAEGTPAGHFDLRHFLNQAGAGHAWTAQDPVARHLAAPGAPDREPAPFLGMELLRLAAATPEHLLFGVVDASGRFLHANHTLQQAFHTAFRRPQTTLNELFPTLAEGPFLDPREIAGRFLTVDRRSFFAFFLPLVVTGSRGFTLLLAQEVSGSLDDALRRATDEAGLLRRVLDVSVDGLMVVDPQGIITLVNRSFEEIHGVTRAQVLGRHVTEVVENTRMHIVAQTGVAEVDDFQEIGEQDFVVTRFPIFQDGKCAGAVGKIIFKDFKEIRRLAAKVSRLQSQLDSMRKCRTPHRADTKYAFPDIVALAEVSREARERATRIAPTAATVLLLGESGVGKEVYAHAIHNLSPRCHHPFVRVNCSAILETLFESELFGYAEGAFTGAKKGGKQGKFELADGGTIFLDEIGDMPLAVQAKLLRVLQEREIDRVGGEGTLPIDVRIIAATNQDLWQLVQQGKFRKDLYYRLNVIPIVIPPLRERPEDVAELIRRFWGDMQRAHGIYHKSLSEGALDLLVHHSWPGNIRELRNVLERALTIVLEDTISEDQVRMILMGLGTAAGRLEEKDDCRLDAVIGKAEKRAISFALARANNNRVQAARLLGISRPLLYRKMHEYGMI